MNNFWGMIGVLVSGTGLFIAIIQLGKIAKRTAAIDETYKKTIEDLKNNETLSNISTALQKIETIKNKIHEDKINELKQDLANVAKLLVTLQSVLANRLNDFDFNFENHKKKCSDLEVRIIISDTPPTRKELEDEYISFTELEQSLTNIQSIIKFKKQN